MHLCPIPPCTFIYLSIYLKKNTHRKVISHFWEYLLKFLEIAGEPLGCCQIRVRIPCPAHGNVRRTAIAMGGEQRGEDGALELECLGSRVWLCHLTSGVVSGPLLPFSVPQIPCALSTEKESASLTVRL